MKILLDTHSFLWWIANSKKISETARELISDSTNEIYLSAVSTWEIAIKEQLGKLSVPKPLPRFFSEQMRLNGFQFLPIELEHSCRVNSLPLIHRDPFDRLLIAQGITENLPILTIDKLIRSYKEIKTIW